ncbi:MAG: hypothetical protein K5905_20370 [Roseibium sp.]|uniref:hypothetical protein n=1 Tax=Roseibium sp. TaxID=1936156 RepID=UPI00261EF33F|nr:hypothetical protein [Roseibium sp.]MCV0427819.1 hypothetical protein [Roseibium sp.]
MTAVAEESAVVTKGEFADILNVSAGRVSQYITEGKISGAALVGEGRRAKINVAVAREQLRNHLDIGQMLGNGLETRLSSVDQPGPLPLETAPPQHTPQPSLDPRKETVEDKLKRERLFQAQIQSRKAAAEEEAEKGRFVSAAEIRASDMRIAVKMIQTFEGALPNMAAAIASRFEVPVRDVLHLLKAEFTEMRSRAADQNRAVAEGLPETVKTEIAPEEQPENVE